MDAQMTELITIIGVVTGLALAYGRAFAGYQAAITQAFIDAFTVSSKYKRLLNLVIGILIASAFTVVGALWLGTWQIVPAGVLAGILAAVEAGKAHEDGTAPIPAGAETKEVSRPPLTERRYPRENR